MNNENLKSREQLIEELQSLEDRINAKVSDSGQTIRSTPKKQVDNIEQLDLIKRLRFKVQNLKTLATETSEESWEALGKKINKDFDNIQTDWVKIDPVVK